MIELIVILAVFVIAYELGKRRGWQDGFAQAEALAPLRLRQESLERGRCCLCQASPDALDCQFDTDERKLNTRITNYCDGG